MFTKENIVANKKTIFIIAGLVFVIGAVAKLFILIALALIVFCVVLFLVQYKPDNSTYLTSLPHKQKIAMLKNQFAAVIRNFAFIIGIPCFFLGFLGTGNSWLTIVGLLIAGLGLYIHFNVLAENKPLENSVEPTKSTDHGSAKWSPVSALSDDGEIRHDEGLYIGSGKFRDKIGSLLTVAGSRQGKGTCLIVPSLLVDPSGSYVVTDPKGENAYITARFQKEAGQNVYILDPWGEQEKMGARHGIDASGFNPFVFLKNDPHELRDNCELLAMYIVPDNPNVKDPYWNDRARSMIKTLLMHIVTALPEEEHNFWTLYKMLRLSDDNWLGLLFDLRNNKAHDELISIAAEELIGMEKSPNTMTGIKSAAQNATSFFESPLLRKSLAKNDFNPYSLTDGNSTVYIVIPERYLETNSAWLRIVVGLCLKACNARPNKRVNFLLDEFGVMGKMKDVQKAYAYASGQNIVLWTFVQSLSMLKEIYGEDGMNTFITNSVVFQTFGVKDAYTTKYVSDMLGEETLEKENFTRGHTDNTQGSSLSISRTYTTFGRKLMTPDEVERYPGIITIMNGHRLLLHRLPYYKSILDLSTVSEGEKQSIRELKEKHAREGGDTKEWCEVFNERADPPPRIV